MKNIIVVYPAGCHGEFFIGNIVSSTDKFHYYYFKCRSEELNAYRYESIHLEDNDSLVAEHQTNDDLDYYSTWHGKPIISRTHNHLAIQKFPVIKLHTADPVYQHRVMLLKCIKTLDKDFSKNKDLPDPPPSHFMQWPNTLKHTTDALLHVDIKEWLHNENLEKIEDFLEIEYTQAMKDAVTQYYERDEILLNRYFPDWQNQTDEHLIKEMARIDKSFQFLG
tara:strand:- start:80 stop:745 length:666 start_codon:yes stop_codon:yes gene_type:complete